MRDFIAQIGQEYFNLNVVSLDEVLLRTALIILFCMAVGLERDSKNKPIDFRAYMIVGLTTCILAIMAQELTSQFEGNRSVTIDLSKIFEGVLTGIGFLGAGAIIKRGDRVVGTATGASIWASGGLGLCLGFGFYGLAFIAFIAIAFTLVSGAFIIRWTQGKEDDGTV